MSQCNWCPPKSKTKFPKPFEIIKGYRQYPNPGTVANLHKKTRNIMPEFFDGIILTYSKGIAPNKTMFGSWTMSHTYPSGFKIGGWYSWKCFGDLMETPVFEADINPSTLASNFSVMFYPFSSFKIETRLQRTETTNEQSFLLEYLGQSETYTLTTFNASKYSGRITFSYLRNITENLTLGGELLYEWLGSGALAKNAFALRYGKDKYSYAATLSADGLDLSYWREISKSTQIGSSLVFNKYTNKAVGSICYQWESKNACIRGMLDSDFSVGSIYRRSLKSIPMTIGLSFLFCIPSNRFGFGLTLDLDPSGQCGGIPTTSRQKENISK